MSVSSVITIIRTMGLEINPFGFLCIKNPRMCTDKSIVVNSVGICEFYKSFGDYFGASAV